jgi:hypothetical protein
MGPGMKNPEMSNREEQMPQVLKVNARFQISEDSQNWPNKNSMWIVQISKMEM